MDIIIVNFAGFINDAIIWLIQIGFNKPQPFRVRKRNIIQRLQLHADIGKHRFL